MSNRLAWVLLFVLCPYFFDNSLFGEETSGSATSTSRAARRPNFIILIADDLGYGELGCYGGQQIATPHIDRLAARGVRFTDAYVCASYCAMSRAGLLTSRYPTRFGFERNPVGAKNLDPTVGLPAAEITWIRRLRDGGYATGLIGKWHLGGTAAYHPLRRGFDEFFGFLHEGHYYVPPPWPHVTTWLRRKALPDGSTGRWVSPDGRLVWSTHMGSNEPPYDADNPILRNSQPVQESSYLTDAFTREACDFIRRHRHQPFCLVVAYSAVHSPLQADDQSLARHADIQDIQRRIFAAMLSKLDESVGQLTSLLQESNLANTTCLVFLSDNGGPTRELTSRNDPLRGEKGSLYEGGIRVPMIVSWPTHFAQQVVDRRMVSALDIGPTLLHCAGLNPPKSIDGKNLAPLLAIHPPSPPSEPVHTHLFWRMNRAAAFRSGTWKIVRHGDSPSDRPWQLYDLATDLSERVNVADQYADRLQQLIEQWESIDATMIAPRW